MKFNFLLLFLVTLVFCSSCEVEVAKDIQNIERLLEISLENGYEVDNIHYEFGIGESIKSFDLIFDKPAFDKFIKDIGDTFIPIDKTLITNRNLDYYKNFEFDGTRIHMSINLSQRTLHYMYVDL